MTTTSDDTAPRPALRRLGRSGLAVSAVGLGCNNFGRPSTATETLEGTRAVVDAALDAGQAAAIHRALLTAEDRATTQRPTTGSDT